MTKRILAAYTAISAVFLLYTPHALPVMDDWTILQIFDRARHGGFSRAILLLADLVDNQWWAQFRIFWATFVPVYLFSFAADFHGWAYFLLAWVAHLLTACLLWRVVLTVFEDSEAAFAAGAIYAVFPAATNPIFWPVSNAHYCFGSLFLLAWFYFTWKKLAKGGACRYSWKDFVLLLPVVFSSEQILPALALLLPVGLWLAGKRKMFRSYFRFCLAHWSAMVLLLGVYIFAVNRAPVLAGFQSRYQGGHRWSLRPVNYFLSGALGLNRDFLLWPARWWADPVLLGVATLAAAAFGWGLYVCGRSREDSRQGELILWSVAGSILTYLPVSRLTTFEWRYLYVPSMFLVAAGCAVVGLLWRPLRVVLSFAVLAYCLTLTYLQMKENWIPQSREAHGVLDAVVSAAPFASHQIFVFSGDHLSNGMAAGFITGASWASGSMLEHFTGADHVEGGRDIVVNEKGELALYRRDSFLYLHRQQFPLLRVFVREGPSNRFLPKSLMALPAPDGRYELVAVGPAAGASIPTASLSLDELKRLPQFGEIYFPRLIHSHMKPTDL